MGKVYSCECRCGKPEDWLPEVKKCFESLEEQFRAMKEPYPVLSESEAYASSGESSMHQFSTPSSPTFVDVRLNNV